MKYHHSERCFTYRMKRPLWSGLYTVSSSWFGIMGGKPLSREVGEVGLAPLPFTAPSFLRGRWLVRTQPWRHVHQPVGSLWASGESCFETSARWGVWLGRHICYTTTQVS